MNFADAGKIRTVISKMIEADEPRQTNRSLINWLFNGDPPYTAQECEENNIDINVNFLDAAKTAHDARAQINNAILKPGNFFNVRIPMGAAPHKRIEYGQIVTNNINRVMKRSQPYSESWRARIANLVLHGLGPVRWQNQYNWVTKPLKIQDLLVPSKTYVGLDNLTHFAIYTEYTPGELYRLTHGPRRDPGWNMELVKRELKRVVDEDTESLFPDRQEDVAEIYKANAGLFDTDAVPTVKVFDFYFQSELSHSGVWQRRMLSAVTDEKASDEKDFLYAPSRVYASKLSEILSIQFADTANVAPFRYHSVRGLGHLLYDVCHLMNRTLCRQFEASFENMMMLFRNLTPADQERMEWVDLHDRGLIPEGLSIVPQSERHQINQALVTQTLAEARQKIQENSASFVQDVNDGTEKEMTAKEATLRAGTASAMIGAMLSQTYLYATFEYIEICRRFCIRNSPDPDVQKFQKMCMAQGVPPQLLNVDYWEVEPERVLGAGNKSQELTQASGLMQARNLFDPDAQRQILHIWTEATTDDPELAEALAPVSKKPISDAVNMAQNDAATLMAGLPLTFRQGIAHIDYVETMLGTMAAVIKTIEQAGQVATAPQILGLKNMARTIGQHIQQIAQDPKEKARVKKYADDLNKMMNLVKAYEQRLAEMQQQAPQQSAKDQALLQTAQTKMQIDKEKAQQKMQQKNTAFALDETRKTLKAKTDRQAKLAETKTKTIAEDLKTAATIAREREKAKHEPKPKTSA